MANPQIPALNVAERSQTISHHDVYFYESDSVLGKELGHHIGPALAGGDTTIVIATKPHCKELREALKLSGIDVKAAIKAEKYIERDATKALAQFMVGGVPDKSKFQNTIGELVGRAASLKATGKNLVLFGEMVALLWSEGRRDATVRLEELWNELGERYSYHLLCGYPTKAFERPEDKQLFFNICGEHCQVNKQQSQLNNADALNDLLAQHRRSASILDGEIRLSQQRILTLQKVTRAGTWELDIANDMFSFSSAAAKVLGFQSASRLRLSQFLGLMYYSGDRESVFERLQQAQRHRRDFTAHFRVGDGNETRLIQIRGITYYNAGNPIMLGMVHDITPVQTAQ